MIKSNYIKIEIEISIVELVKTIAIGGGPEACSYIL